jgi:hypothetical protein
MYLYEYVYTHWYAYVNIYKEMYVYIYQAVRTSREPGNTNFDVWMNI